MITPDEYPLYNHRERPGIGRDQLGNTFYNCFSIILEKGADTRYRPYVFSDFVSQYNRYAQYSNTCESCISDHEVITFPAEGNDVDRSAIDRKFSHGETRPADHYYCPMIRQVLSASQVNVQSVEISQKSTPAEPIRAILSGNWDDDYLLEFQKISPPQQLEMCPVLNEVLSSRYMSSGAERSFFVLWFLAMFHQMDAVRQAGLKVYLEDADFDVPKNKLYKFLFPLPQVWVYIIPKPPPRVDWQEWEQQHHTESVPQRVDFLFTYNGNRHIVEIDGMSHYAVQSRGTWVPSESQYRQTLSDTRWLRKCGFAVHRFTNEELLELYDPNSLNEPDVTGFVRLLREEGLQPERMVFLEN